MIGAGGIRFAPDGYLHRVREIVRDAGALFVSDEVITGFGRTGEWFGSQRFGLDPDLVTFAKGVTSGYVPLGGVLAAPHVAEPFWRGGVMWRHGYTYSGHTTACVAALANLAIMERRGARHPRQAAGGPARRRAQPAPRPPARLRDPHRRRPCWRPFSSTRRRSPPTPRCPAVPQPRAATPA